MTGNTSVTTDTATTDEGAPTPPSQFEKGSWQNTLSRSAVLFDKSAGDRKRATVLLWDGAKSGIESWLPESSTDAGAELLSVEMLNIMGKGRKGDVSKIKTVAVAVKHHGLDLDGTNVKGKPIVNLSMAYAEARRLTQTVAQEAAEDDAAEKAVEGLTVPNSTTTVEGAALILLSKGVDGAVVAILDALGAKNEAAHRSFMRAVSTEVAARVQAAKPKPAPKGPKAGATQAKSGGSKAAPKAQSGAAKAKPTTKAKPAAAATAEKATAAPAKAKPQPVKRPARKA